MGILFFGRRFMLVILWYSYYHVFVTLREVRTDGRLPEAGEDEERNTTDHLQAPTLGKGALGPLEGGPSAALRVERGDDGILGVWEKGLFIPLTDVKFTKGWGISVSGQWVTFDARVEGATVQEIVLNGYGSPKDMLSLDPHLILRDMCDAFFALTDEIRTGLGSAENIVEELTVGVAV